MTNIEDEAPCPSNAIYYPDDNAFKNSPHFLWHVSLYLQVHKHRCTHTHKRQKTICQSSSPSPM